MNPTSAPSSGLLRTGGGPIPICRQADDHWAALQRPVRSARPKTCFRHWQPAHPNGFTDQ